MRGEVAQLVEGSLALDEMPIEPCPPDDEIEIAIESHTYEMLVMRFDQEPPDGPCSHAKKNGCRRGAYYPNGWCGYCLLIRCKKTGRYADYSKER